MIKKILGKFIPDSVRVDIYESNLAQTKAKLTKESAEIPRVDLEAKHLQNAKLLPNRTELLKLMPKDAVIAEIGVDNGDFSQKILDTCSPKKLHLVDIWGSERYSQTKRKKVEDRYSKQRENGQVQIDLGLSTDVGVTYEDKYFDWIYIDTDHSYKTTAAELEVYHTKVKPGGIIAGHDFIIGNWNGLVRYGVVEAVHEFCKHHDWEIIYISAEMTNHPSFAIRKIGA